MSTKNSKTLKIAEIAIRVLLAAVFVVSSVAKLIAIDDFEVYVFSYGFFSLNVTYILVRLCIGAELALGLLIACGWWKKIVNLVAFAMLLFFSLFLCYAALIGRNESCQCFGKMADMPPAVSLLKNAIIILIVLLYMRLSARSHQRGSVTLAAKIVSAVVVVGAMVVPFVVSVPDSWMFGPEKTLFDKELLNQTIEERGLGEGHRIVSFVTPGCHFCQMTRSKLEAIAKRNGLDYDDFVFIEPDEWEDDTFLRLTYGQRPIVMLLDNGQPTTTYHYRNINEKQIANFLKE